MVNNLRQRGLLITCYKMYFHVYGLIFDLLHRRINTTTTSPIEMHGFAPNIGTANFPCHPRLLSKALGRLNVTPADTFLDVGCGKGRALVVASRFPFRRLYGIEIVPDNASIAKTNLARIADHALIYCEDARTFVPPDPMSIAAFFKPFEEPAIVAMINRFHPPLPRALILVNTSIVTINGYDISFEIQHRIYPNFSYRIFTRSSTAT